MIKINATQILPIAMILLDVGAAAVCLWHKDYRRTVYWIAAAVLNLTVTFRGHMYECKERPICSSRLRSIIC